MLSVKIVNATAVQVAARASVSLNRMPPVTRPDITREEKGNAVCPSTAAVPSGSDRADFVFLSKDQLSRRYPEIPLAGLPERGGAALVLATSDLAAAEKAVGSAGVHSGGAVCVAPAAANGTLLAFVKA